MHKIDFLFGHLPISEYELGQSVDIWLAPPHNSLYRLTSLRNLISLSVDAVLKNL